MLNDPNPTYTNLAVISQVASLEIIGVEDKVCLGLSDAVAMYGVAGGGHLP